MMQQSILPPSTLVQLQSRTVSLLGAYPIPYPMGESAKSKAAKARKAAKSKAKSLEEDDSEAE
jgi:hypothetical protein